MVLPAGGVPDISKSISWSGLSAHHHQGTARGIKAAPLPLRSVCLFCFSFGFWFCFSLFCRSLGVIVRCVWGRAHQRKPIPGFLVLSCRRWVGSVPSGARSDPGHLSVPLLQWQEGEEESDTGRTSWDVLKTIDGELTSQLSSVGQLSSRNTRKKMQIWFFFYYKMLLLSSFSRLFPRDRAAGHCTASVCSVTQRTL